MGGESTSLLNAAPKMPSLLQKHQAYVKNDNCKNEKLVAIFQTIFKTIVN